MNRPLLLVVLAPELALLVLIGAQVALAPMLLVGVPRRILGMGAAFIVGRAYGAPAVEWVAGRSLRARRALGWLERAVRRLGAPLLFLIPSSAVALVAGSLGVGARAAAIASTVGSAVLLLLLHHAGEAVTEWVETLKSFLAGHLVAATVVSVSLAVLYEVWHRRR